MALLVKDRIKETTSTTGTGTLTLAGAVAGYQAFSVLGNGATTYYALTDANGTAWEVGLGTYTTSGTTLARTTVLDSSNSGSKITLTSGTHDVFVTYPAGKAGFNDQGISKTFTASGTITAGKPCILEADGDAAQIVETGNTVTGGTGTVASFTGNSSNYADITDIGSDKYLISYRDGQNSGYATVVVATQSGENRTLSFGTPVVAQSLNIQNTTIEWNPNDSKALLVYRRDAATEYAYMHNVTVSGTTPSVTTQQDLETGEAVYYPGSIYNPDTQRINVHYTYDGGNKRLRIHSIDTSGANPSSSYNTSITESNSGDHQNECRVDYDTVNNKFLYANINTSNDYVYGRIVTDSGSAFTAADRLALTSATANTVTCNYDVEAGKFLISYTNLSDKKTLAIATTYNAGTANTNLDKGTAVQLDSRDLDQSSAASSYDTYNKVTTIIRGSTTATQESGQSGYYSVKLTGTTPSLESSGYIPGTSTYDISRIQMPRQHMTTETPYYPVAFVGGGWQGQGDKCYYGVYRTVQNPVTNLDDNYLGVASTSATNTNPVDINIVGSINNNQTGLTVGDDYFSDDAGNIKKFITSATSTNASPTGNFAVMDDSDTTSADISSTYESNSSTYVLAYKDASNSSYGTAVAGTWSSGTVTWGTPVVFESSAIDDQPHICSGGNRVHVTYRASDGAGGIRSASISGTAMTFAAETIFAPSDATYGNPMGYHCVYDTSTNYVIIAYSGGTGSPHNFFAQPLHHDTSDGTYTLGAATTLNVNSVQVSHLTDLVFDPDTNRSVVVYVDGNNSNQVTAQVIQSTGTSGSPTVTAGADSIIDAGDGATELCACYDTENNKVFVAYDNSTDGETKGIIGTVTGGGTNTIAFTGNATIWNPSGNPSNFDIEFDGDNNKAFFFYRDEDSGDDLTYKILTLGASSFSVADGAVLSANDNRLNSGAASFGTGKGVLVGLYDTGNSAKVSYATVYYGTTTTYTKTNSQYIGKALSATALELKDQDPNTLYGQSEGAIAKGKPVIVEADGDFAEVAIDSQTTNYTYSKGTEVELKATNIKDTVQSCYAANVDRFVVTYTDGDNANIGRAIVVTTSGTTPSVTATGNFDASAYGGENSQPVYDSVNKKVVIIYQAGNDSNKGESIVATVAESAITFGTSVQYNTSSQGGSGDRRAYFDEENEKIVVFGRDQSNSNYPTVWIGTVSGTSITWGSGVVIESSGVTAALAAQYSPTDKKGLFIFEDSSYYGQAIVGTVSGTSMTFGSKLQFTTENISHSDAKQGNMLCYDTGVEKFLFLYQISSGDDGEGIVFTISGTSVTAGSETNLHDNWTNISTIGKSDFGKIPVIFKNSVSHTKYAEITITGTTPALSGEVQLNSGPTYFNGLSLDTTQGDIKLLATYEDGDNDLAATVIIPNGTRTVSTANLTTENYIGIAKDAASDNDTAIIQTVGSTDNNQSSLTPGQVYYVQTDGTLSTTAGSPSVVAGRAISATEILITRS